MFLLKLRIWPQKLKYRLFAAFFFFILLPLFCLQFYSYNQIEYSISREFTLKTNEQLNLVKELMVTIMDSNFKDYLFLEKSPSIRNFLQYPEIFNSDERNSAMNGELARLKSRFPPYIQYTLADMHGDMYQTVGSANSMAYEAFVHMEEFKDLKADHFMYRWHAGEVLSLYSVLFDDNGRPYGYLRIQFQYGNWLSHTSKELLLQQHYSIIDTQGTILTSTDIRHHLDKSLISKIINEDNPIPSMMDSTDLSIINSVFVYEQQWYIVSKMPMRPYLGDLRLIKNRFFTIFLILCSAFIAVTFLISSTILKPLRLLQQKMAESADKELKVHFSESRFKGEIQDIAVTFNKMVSDIQILVSKLKLEERQKEAVRYQMLLSQMNPHFLLNTLNTIKWNALDKDDEETAEICTALGRLLETSLNLDVELIHLQQEMELLSTYFYIHNLRYEGLFEIVYEVAEGLDYSLVPKFGLQPLVENAFTHGFSRMPLNAKITVRVYRQNSLLHLEIEDNGIGLWGANQLRSPRKRKGIGIINLRERLKLLFPNEGKLELLELPSGTLARITLPLLVSKPYQTGEDGCVEHSAGRR